MLSHMEDTSQRGLHVRRQSAGAPHVGVRASQAVCLHAAEYQRCDVLKIPDYITHVGLGYLYIALRPARLPILRTAFQSYR